MTMDRIELASLLDTHLAAPDLQPRYFCKKCGQEDFKHERGGHKFVEDYVSTFCNIFVHRVACEFGYTKFKGMLANEICDQIQKDKKSWVEVTGDKASGHAWVGKLVIAAQRGKPHGHVAVAYPGGLVYSGKWEEECPTLANCGLTMGVMGANYAFPKMPAYWLLQDE